MKKDKTLSDTLPVRKGRYEVHLAAVNPLAFLSLPVSVQNLNLRLT